MPPLGMQVAGAQVQAGQVAQEDSRARHVLQVTGIPPLMGEPS